MTERGILFSGAMVRALLDGSKTQTRRVVKPQPANDPANHHPIKPYNTSRGQWNWILAATGHGTGDPFDCPYGLPGDRLWVRETCIGWENLDGLDGVRYPADDAFRPIEDSQSAADQWLVLHTYRGERSATVPSIHMPRWASRILLEITGVRVERLQAISEADCYDEGVQAWAAEVVENGNKFSSIRTAWRALWESTGGDWDGNPWVWVVEFRRIES